MASTGKYIIFAVIMCVSIEEIRHNKCVTWHDDLKTLTVTCRVDDISQPVSIFHEKSGINATCLTIDNSLSCHPTETNTSVDLNNHTLSIQLIELKSDNQLEGNWNCSQGKTKLSTRVSFKSGIISDAWVNIRGKILHNVNNSTDVIVECGSCRQPDANYVEFLINNNSNGSMMWNEKERVCTYRNKKCDPFICNCSSIGNMFQLKIPLSNDVTEIACDMHFHDGYRKGKFGISSSLVKTEADFIYDDSIKYTIFRNKVNSTAKTTIKTVEGNDIVTVDPSHTTDETKNSDNDSLVSIIVAVVVIVLILVIVVGIYHVYKRNQLKGNGERPNNSPESINSHGHDESELHPLLSNHSKVINVIPREVLDCQSCRNINNTNKVVSYCIHCGDNLCSLCHTTHGKIVKFENHVVVKLEDLPNGFLPLVCKKHNKKEFEIYCITHKDILCMDCFHDHSNNCQWKSIDKICKQNTACLEFRYDLPQLSRKLQSKIDDLDKYNELFAKDSTDATSKIKMLETRQIPDEQCTWSNKQKSLLDQLKVKQTEYNNKYTKEKQDTERLLNLVKSEEMILTFISNNVGEKLLFVHVQMAMKRVDAIESSMKDIGSTMGRTELNFRWSFDNASLGTFESSFIRSTSTTCPQSPSVMIQTYLRQEKQFKLHFSNLAYVDGSLALVSNKATAMTVYNIKTETSTNIDIKFTSHDIEVIPSTKRVIITCENEDKLQEVDLESNDHKIWDVKYSSRAAIAITPCFILLGFEGKRIISVLQHDGMCVLNIATNENVHRLCYYDDRISYLSLKSEALISIDVTGEHLHKSGKPKPVDILTINRGHYIVLEESEKVLSKSSMDGKELALNFEQKFTWKNATAICSNGDASELFVLSYNETATVLHMLTLPNTFGKQ